MDAGIDEMVVEDEVKLARQAAISLRRMRSVPRSSALGRAQRVQDALPNPSCTAPSAVTR